MGIQKIGCQKPKLSVHCKQSSISIADEINQDGRTVTEIYSGDDSDSEPTEAGCELCMIGDQLCSIPYELYVLPDLREILSLETWNSCLTDQERFSLSAYLPDMEQHMFWVTMKELLGGKNIFFGSPLMELFERLRGGLCSPCVNYFREGLHFLERRAFYYSVRSYHENLTSTLSDMKRLWRKCRPSASIEERLCMWNMWKNHKGKDEVDLNAFPAEDDSSTDGKEVITGPGIKKMKTPILNGISLVHANSNPKGVLKIKPGGLNNMQNGVIWRPPPKGVLKRIPRGRQAQPQQHSALSARQEATSLMDISVLPQLMSRAPLPHSAVQWDSGYCNNDMPFLHQPVRGRKAYVGSELPEFVADRLKVEEYSNSSIEPSSVRMMRVVKDPVSDNIGGVEDQNIFPKNLQSMRRYSCQNIETEKHVIGRSPQKYSSSKNMDCYNNPREQQLMPVNEKKIPTFPRTSEVVTGISGIETVGSHMLPKLSLDRSTTQDRDVARKGILEPDEKPDGNTLPITYKRRKAQMKLDSLSSVKPFEWRSPF
ncbi:hypothetical protein ACLOJK_037702 [Asimina triloba]